MEIHSCILYSLGNESPIDVCEIYFTVDVCIMLKLFAYDTHLYEHFSTTILDGKTSREDVVLRLRDYKHTLWNANSAKDEVNIRLQLIET